MLDNASSFGSRRPRRAARAHDAHSSGLQETRLDPEVRDFHPSTPAWSSRGRPDRIVLHDGRVSVPHSTNGLRLFVTSSPATSSAVPPRPVSSTCRQERCSPWTTRTGGDARRRSGGRPRRGRSIKRRLSDGARTTLAEEWSGRRRPESRSPAEEERPAARAVWLHARGADGDRASVGRPRHEPTSSMGDDTALPPLAGRARPLFSYFRQRFAQVTNPRSTTYANGL